MIVQAVPLWEGCVAKLEGQFFGENKFMVKIALRIMEVA